jgi:outer membrane protein OmpA-like peptidoglycan-associated protein/osmotically-inducible protein OsmY
MAGSSGVARLARHLVLPVVVSVLGIAGLMAVQLTVTKDAVEQRLGTGVTEALQRAGAQGIDVTVDGRDVTLRGIAANGVVLATALNSVRSVEGVRRTLNQIKVVEAPSVGDLGPSQLTATITRGRITLNGSVPTRSDRQRLVAAAERAVGSDRVEGHLVVAVGASPDGVKALIAVVAAFDPGGDTSAELMDGVISLFGRVPRQESRDAIVGAANRVMNSPNSPSRIVDQLAIDEDQLPPEAVALEHRLAGLPEIAFSSGGSHLDDSDREIVRRAAKLLDAHPNLRVRVEGHTSSSGSSESNLELSQDRAAEVRDALVEEGIAGDRVDAVGYGEYRAAVDPTGKPLPNPTGSSGQDDLQRDIVFTIVL